MDAPDFQIRQSIINQKNDSMYMLVKVHMDNMVRNKCALLRDEHDLMSLNLFRRDEWLEWRSITIGGEFPTLRSHWSSLFRNNTEWIVYMFVAMTKFIDWYRTKWMFCRFSMEKTGEYTQNGRQFRAPTPIGTLNSPTLSAAGCIADIRIEIFRRRKKSFCISSKNWKSPGGNGRTIIVSECASRHERSQV